MRTALLTLAALVLGFSVGWLAHAPAAQLPANDTPVVVPAPVTTALPGPATTPVAPTGNPAATPARNEQRNRLETLRWLAAAGLRMNLSPFTGDNLDRTMVRILDLNEAQVARLGAATRQARVRVEAARTATAFSHPGTDEKSLVVEVPSLSVAASRAIYDQLQEEFRSTLDADQFATFTELEGEEFDRSFDRFGLNAVRYEVSPTPLSINGMTFVDYKRSFVDATGTSTGWSQNKVPPAQLEKTDPLLAKFLPASLKTQQGPP